MSKNNSYTKDLIGAGLGALLVYMGGQLQYNSGSYMNMNDFTLGLLFVILGSMIVGVAINKISVKAREETSIGTTKKVNKGKARNAKSK